MAPDSSFVRIVAVETSLGTNFILSAPLDSTISELRGLIQKEHVICFPQYGLINVGCLAVKYDGKQYHMTGSLLVSQVLRKSWSKIYAEATQISFKSISDNVKPLDSTSGEINAALQCDNSCLQRQTPRKNDPLGPPHAPGIANKGGSPLIEENESRELVHSLNCLGHHVEERSYFPSTKTVETRKESKNPFKISQKDDVQDLQKKCTKGIITINPDGESVQYKMQNIDNCLQSEQDLPCNVEISGAAQLFSGTDTNPTNRMDHDDTSLVNVMNDFTERTKEQSTTQKSNLAVLDFQQQTTGSESRDGKPKGKIKTISSNHHQDHVCMMENRNSGSDGNEEFIMDENTGDSPDKSGLDTLLKEGNMDLTGVNKEGISTEFFTGRYQCHESSEHPMQQNHHNMFVTSDSAGIVPETQECEMNAGLAFNVEQHENPDDNTKNLSQECDLEDANSNRESENDSHSEGKITSNASMESEQDMHQEENLPESVEEIKKGQSLLEIGPDQQYEDEDNHGEENLAVMNLNKDSEEEYRGDFPPLGDGGNPGSKNANTPLKESELSGNGVAENRVIASQQSNSLEKDMEFYCDGRDQSMTDDKHCSKRKRSKKRKVAQMPEDSTFNDCLPSNEINIKMSSHDAIARSLDMQEERPLNVDSRTHYSLNCKRGDSGSLGSKKRNGNKSKQSNALDSETVARTKEVIDNLTGQETGWDHANEETLGKVNCGEEKFQDSKKKTKKRKQKKISSLHHDADGAEDMNNRKRCTVESKNKDERGESSDKKSLAYEHSSDVERGDLKVNCVEQATENNFTLYASERADQDDAVFNKHKKHKRKKNDSAIRVLHETGAMAISQDQGFDAYEFQSASSTDGGNNKMAVDSLLHAPENDNLNGSSSKAIRRSTRTNSCRTVLSERLSRIPKQISTTKTVTHEDEMNDDCDKDACTEEGSSQIVVASGSKMEACPFGCGKLYSKKTSAFYKHRRQCSRKEQ